MDRELYLPKSWTDDRDRCRAARVPDQREFATKNTLAATIVRRALASRLPIAWVTADAAYGQDNRFRRMLETSGVGYVLAVPKSQFSLAGPRIDRAFEQVPEQAWERRSCGAGAKGQREYDWAAVQLRPVAEYDHQDGVLIRRRWALARRSLSRPDEIAYCLGYAPLDVGVDELVRVVGARWAIEECFQAAKNECGLDEYEVRRYVGWYRHITLAMLAHTFLAAMSARAAERGDPPVRLRDVLTPARGPHGRYRPRPGSRTGAARSVEGGAEDNTAWQQGPPGELAGRMVGATLSALTTPPGTPVPDDLRVSATAARSRSTTPAAAPGQVAAPADPAVPAHRQPVPPARGRGARASWATLQPASRATVRGRAPREAGGSTISCLVPNFVADLSKTARGSGSLLGSCLSRTFLPGVGVWSSLMNPRLMLPDRQGRAGRLASHPSRSRSRPSWKPRSALSAAWGSSASRMTRASSGWRPALTTSSR